MMSRDGARRLLWVFALLLVPLPYFVIAEGAVPVVRFAMLGAITTAYAAFVNGGGVAWIMVAFLVGHAVVYTLGLWALAAGVARLLPERARTGFVAALIVVGLVGSLAFDVYSTPFAADSTHASLMGLFR